jgi:hypothetical protein
MYALKNKINDIPNSQKGMFISNKTLFFERKVVNDYFLMNLKNTNTVKLNTYFDHYIFLKNKGILLRLSDGSGILIDFDGNLLMRFKNENFAIPFKFDSEIDSDYLICFKGRLFDREYGVFDLNGIKSVFYDKKILNGFFYKNLFFNISDKNFFCIEFPLNEPLWHFSLGEIGRWYSETDGQWKEGAIEHFVGVANGVLWVDIMAHTLIGIDVSTGELKHLLKEAQPMNIFPTVYLPLIPYYGKSTYDKGLNKIWGIYASSYWEVDLNETAPQIKTWYLGEELQKYNATFPNSPMCGIRDNYVFLQ